MLLVLLCLLCVTPGPAWSAAEGRIEGRVQQEGNAIANHRIMLIRFGPGQDVNRTPGETDAKGGFVFEGLETGDQFTYVVGIRYEGKLFRSESLQLADRETKTEVVVQVGAAGTSALGSEREPAQVRMPQHIVAIVWRDHRLDIREIVKIENSGPNSYRGELARQRNYVLHVPLPEGYDNLQDVQGVKPEHLRSDRFGLYLTEPLAPGTHQLIYTYTLPMTERVRTLLMRQSLPTGLVDLFIDAQQLVATSSFEFIGEVPIQSHTFLHFRGTASQVGDRNWVQMTRLQTGVSRVLRVASYTLVVAIALLGLAIPLYSQWRRRSQTQDASTSTHADMQAWQAERSRLLVAIAQLDNDQAAGILEESIYRQQRQHYKQQLRQVAEALYRADQPLDEPALATSPAATPHGAMHKGLP
jgi:hypothetical protein